MTRSFAMQAWLSTWLPPEFFLTYKQLLNSWGVTDPNIQLVIAAIVVISVALTVYRIAKLFGEALPIVTAGAVVLVIGLVGWIADKWLLWAPFAASLGTMAVVGLLFWWTKPRPGK